MITGDIGEVLGKLIGFYSGTIASLVVARDDSGAIDGREFAGTLREARGTDVDEYLAGELADVIEARLDRRDPPEPPRLRIVQ